MGQLPGASAEILQTEAGYSFPKIHPRMQWAGSLALDIGAGADQIARQAGHVAEIGSAVWQDVKNGTPADKAWIVASAVGFGFNFSQARTALTVQAELQAYQHQGPVAAAVVGSSIHFIYYGCYGEIFSRGVHRAHRAIESLNKNFSLDKVNLPGLAPGSLDPPEHVRGRVRRAGSRLWRHNERRMVSKAGVSLYIALGAVQDQSKQEEARMRWGILGEGTFWAIFKSTLFASALVTLTKADPEVAGSFINFAKSPELSPIYAFGPIAFMAARKAVKERQQRRAEIAEAELQPPMLLIPAKAGLFNQEAA